MVWMERSEKKLLEALVALTERAVRLLEIIAAELLEPASGAVTAVLSLGGPMPLTVGGTTTATLTFNDANGEAAAPPTGDGSGLSVTFNSSDVTIATVGTATLDGQTYTAEVTGVAEGSYTLNAAVENTSGAALVDDDGTTAFVQPTAADGTVGEAPAGQAVTATITIA
jgi:hypothetical protein